MAQLITTKYIGPSVSKGSRIQVKSWIMTTYFNYDNALESNTNHYEAILEHLKKIKARKGSTYRILGLTNHVDLHSFMGSLPQGGGYGVVVL